MNEEYEFDEVDHFTVGAVGEPGRRVFMIQGAQGNNVLTLKAEKMQIAGLASYLAGVIADLARPGHLPEDLDLRPPLEIAWVAGQIAISYDEALDRVIVEIEQAGDASEQFAEQTDAEQQSVRFYITREQAAAVAIKGTSLVEAGRPACPLCGYPIDADGHACPRTNGNRPPNI